MNFDLPQNVEQEEVSDRISGYVPLDSGVYPGVCELVYVDKSSSGAISLNFVFKTKKEEATIRQTIYISNRKGEYVYERNGKVFPLPGYTEAESLLLSINGKKLNQQTVEPRTIKLYDRDARTELPVERDVFIDTINVPVALGVLHVKEERTTKESNYTEGTGEYREYNKVNKIFDINTGLTYAEKQAGQDAPDFLNKWKKKYEGEVETINAPKSRASGSTTSTPVRSTAQNAQQSKSLFDD